MVRAVLLIGVFVALLAGSAMNEDMRAVMALAGIVGVVWGLGWLIEPKR